MVARAKREPRGRLIAVEIDETSLAPATSFVDSERAAAMRDLLADNVFSPLGKPGDAFRLRLSLVERKLALDIANREGVPLVRHILSLAPLRRVIKDYFLICESYYVAVRAAPPDRIEAIDMGRRGLHDEGAGILRARLEGKVAIDHATARRLFTLVVGLHWKG